MTKIAMKSQSVWLRRFSLFLSAGTLFLILAGGLVTSHEAGLAVPDWPLSYGQVFPPMVGNVFWEHGHRMIAGAVGVLTLILAIWLQASDVQAWLKRLGWVSLAAVVLQALLGGLTVLMMLPAPVSIFHACLGQSFFCLVTAIAYFLNRSEASPSQEADLHLKRMARLTTGMLFLQLVLGAIVRHADAMIWFHVIFAFVVIAHIFLLVSRVVRFDQRDTGLFKMALGTGLFTVVQFFLGMGAFIFTRMIERGYAPTSGEVLFTAAHQTNGAIILALSVLIAIKVSEK